MTTQETIQLAYNAQTLREESWDEVAGGYTLTQEQAVEKAASPRTVRAEIELAIMLNRHLWNEVQDFYHGNWTS